MTGEGIRGLINPLIGRSGTIFLMVMDSRVRAVVFRLAVTFPHYNAEKFPHNGNPPRKSRR
jgi:hypothetical protein